MTWSLKRFLGAAACSALFNGVAGTVSIPIPGQNPCPAPCPPAGSEGGNWTTYPTLERLGLCNQSMLLDFALYTPLGDQSKTKTIKACTPVDSTARRSKRQVPARQHRRGSQTSVNVETAWWNSAKPLSKSDALASTNQVQDYMSTHTTSSLVFGYHGNAAVGIWLGALARDDFLKSTVLQQFVDRINGGGDFGHVLMQACGSGFGADYAFGIVAASGDSKLATVQDAVKTWSNSSCVTGADGTASSGTVTLSSPPKAHQPPKLSLRDSCRTITVASGDSCTSLASKCGISLDTFQSYNPGPSFCSSLQPTQPVCCSSGTLPTPQPGPDGTCATYQVQSGDWCAKIAAANSISVANLESWNAQTWGWMTCNNLQAGLNICLSSGNPPMPAPAPNSVCGPTVPGTAKPAGGVSLATLNPCPLNACCDVWGQCGVTPDFCTPSGNGAPGTAAPGTNGCISNCGTNIISSSPPETFNSITYFEGWAPSRSCLNMDVTQINPTKYNKVHFGFAGLTSDYFVDTSLIQPQFNKFKYMISPAKKILSFGGWTFSTNPVNYTVFRSGIQPQNRDQMSTNIANFINSNNMDGVDIDWEYFGATGAPNDPQDGANYMAFLALLRSKLIKGKTLSIAVPASYWSLKGFPVAAISWIVDYFVYMTYDLHGQWDYGSNSDPSCPGGGCLRSHVNLTETEYALAMMTKSGVPSYKIVVGVSSYGRSFHMADPSCTGPTCKFTGPNSGAAPGACTGTAGYLANAEIGWLLGNGTAGATHSVDQASDSDIVTTGGDWVAYMSEATKAGRVQRYKNLGFGGTSDWAVDLQ